jgi:putative ABC transport system substrate-binding protein
MISRRSIVILGSAAAAQAALAQGSRVPRVAILEWEPAAGADRLLPFREALRGEGFIEGQNISIEAFFAGGRAERVEALAQDIARDGFDLIVAFATPAAHAAKRATTRIPIVFGTADPLGTGLVTNLARPGGNLTGVSSMIADIEGKRLALLRELMPNVERVGFIASSVDPATRGFVREAQAAGGRLGIAIVPHLSASPEALGDAVDAALKAQAQALIIQPLFTLSNHSSSIIAAITRQRRLPAIGTYTTFVRLGGLASYGPHLDFARRRTAQMAARVLRGANPGEMPVEQPTEFQLAINVQAAREFGIAVPALTLAQADEVIE